MTFDEKRYQVFVSSTFTDLKDEREKVLQAILQLRAFPAGMELFPAANDEQFEFIKREIDSSDYYVLIIAGRYGSVADSGISYTEMEYDYAIEQGKPVLVFVVKDVGKLIGDKLEHSDDLRRKLETFTKKAMNGRLVDFFSNPDELKAAVLMSLTSQFNLTPMRGWTRAGQTSRQDLQAITDLQGRVIELENQNRKLRELEQSPTRFLANGSQQVSWELSLADIPIQMLARPTWNVSLTISWDDLFRSIFENGDVSPDERTVKTHLARLIVAGIPADPIAQGWKRELEASKIPTVLPLDSLALTRVFKDTQRQLNGLGLIDVVTETRYIIEGFSNQPVPRTIKAWSLTQQGRVHLAVIAGHRAKENA